MANRYWVGTGTWDSTNTANWSATSGGSGGASVPTNGDFVYFDSNSTTNCTHQNYNGVYLGGLDFSGYTGVFTNNATLRVDGSLTFSASMTLGGYSSIYVWPGALGVAKTAYYTPNGKSPYTIEFIAQSGSTLYLSGTVSVGAYTYFSLRGGTIYTNNNTINTDSGGTVGLGSNYNYGANYLYLGSSTINAGRFDFRGGGNANVNIYGSSATVNLSGGSVDCYLGSSLLTSAFTIGSVNVSGSVSNAYYSQYNTSLHRVGTLWINSTTSNHNFQSDFYTNSFQVTGQAKTVRSNSLGTARTITAASFYILENVSFRDITAAGNIPFSGTGLVDLGGNTNITFPVPGSSLFFGSNF